ncbi:hypothetical protein [Hyphococcus sp.]|uniref:hypothetical protein n=1 Tax=Hyphococcus sp. TaxID=2038636 RepID=UPI00208D12AF|nr:MAG: hypothetical protein DHS20C04_22050 [Marinicaulis sp.]
MNKRLAVALFAALAVTGCAGNQEAREARKARAANPAPCPNIVVLSEAARFIDFDGAQTIENVTYTGEVVNVTSTCRYFEDEPIKAGLTIDFAFGRGPKATVDKKVFNYFVAVTRRDSDVIAKVEYPLQVSFSGDQPVQTAKIDIDDIIIPRAGEEISGLNFEIVVGFSVTPQQAIYNRSGKSLKFPDIK